MTIHQDAKRVSPSNCTFLFFCTLMSGESTHSTFLFIVKSVFASGDKSIVQLSKNHFFTFADCFRSQLNLWVFPSEPAGGVPSAQS